MQIENNKAVLTVSEHAAEITGFTDKETGREYMWNGDPAFWAGRNPILFPIVGNTWSKSYTWNGKTYSMGNHGVARNAEFTCVEHTEDRIVMQLKDSAESLAVYPFPFVLEVSYTLKEKKVLVDYKIENTGTERMPFSFGLHPAFKCPTGEGENFFDYWIELACEERLNRLNKETLEFVPDEFTTKKIALDYDVLFNTIVLQDALSPRVSLTNGEHGVTISCAGYKWLAFWTKPNAPYVCLEPWHGHGDFGPNDTPFDKREGTVVLAPGGVYRTSYDIEIF